MFLKKVDMNWMAETMAKWKHRVELRKEPEEQLWVKEETIRVLVARESYDGEEAGETRLPLLGQWRWIMWIQTGVKALDWYMVHYVLQTACIVWCETPVR